jgi:hypothetical protein
VSAEDDTQPAWPSPRRWYCPICGLPWDVHTESCEALWEEER